jgi:hypothetical protein
MRARQLLLMIPLICGAGQTSAQEGAERFTVELEVGAVWQSQNDVEIPNDGTATRFSLVDLAGNGPWPAGRVYVTWSITERNGLRALAAPLSYTETGVLQEPVIFVGEQFLAGTPTEATYQFNSWRLGYRFRFYSGESWRWWVGFTAKIRDAKIELSQGTVSAKKTDTGFVPLVHLSTEYRFAGRWRVLLDAEALGGGPGRAEDIALKVGWDPGEHWTVTVGVRAVEGGADVEEVYNFAWFNYAVVSGIYRWG